MVSNGFVSANIHITDSCNYGCIFCFSKGKCSSGKQLSKKQWKARLCDLITEHDIQKINIAGGEPVLYPHLNECLKTAKEYGSTTSITSNGSLINERFFIENKGNLDWIGLSIDSTREDVENALGRHCENIIHLDNVIKVSRLAKKHGVKVKLNVTVTKFCKDDDFSEYIEYVNPDRIKFLQVCQINNLNNSGYGMTSISKDDFEKFKWRHSWIRLNNGMKPIFESSEDMTNSYLMLDCAGNIRVNSNNGYEFIDYDDFWNSDVSEHLDKRKYLCRGGIYNWGAGGVKNE